VRHSLAVLCGGTLCVWAAAAYPAWLLWGQSALVFSSVAAVICLVPALATLAWSARASFGTPEQQLAALFGGTGVRMVVAVATGIILYKCAPAFAHAAFLIWIIVFYLTTLALEIVVLVNRPAPHKESRPS
jgi:hypothetical protein